VHQTRLGCGFEIPSAPSRSEAGALLEQTERTFKPVHGGSEVLPINRRLTSSTGCGQQLERVPEVLTGGFDRRMAGEVGAAIQRAPPFGAPAAIHHAPPL
jgi:hypothetical protein